MSFRQIVQWVLDFPLRRKLILSFLVIIAIGGILTLLVGTRIEHQTIISLAEAKVRHDLASAWMVYEERLNSLRDTVRLRARQEDLREALRGSDAAGSPSGPGPLTRRSATTPPGTLSSPGPSGTRPPPAPGSSPGKSFSGKGPTWPTGPGLISSRPPWPPRGPRTTRTKA
jgi:hypothetical protein